MDEPAQGDRCWLCRHQRDQSCSVAPPPHCPERALHSGRPWPPNPLSASRDQASGSHPGRRAWRSWVTAFRAMAAPNRVVAMPRTPEIRLRGELPAFRPSAADSNRFATVVGVPFDGFGLRQRVFQKSICRRAASRWCVRRGPQNVPSVPPPAPA